jgi:hypothetical protein
LNDESYIGWLRKNVGNGLILSPSVGAVIHDHDGRLLLQEKSSGEAWSFPAGGIEKQLPGRWWRRPDMPSAFMAFSASSADEHSGTRIQMAIRLNTLRRCFSARSLAAPEFPPTPKPSPPGISKGMKCPNWHCRIRSTICSASSNGRWQTARLERRRPARKRQSTP